MLGGVLVVLAANDFHVFGGGGRPHTRPAVFDAARAYADVRMQVRRGPRPAGSAVLRRLSRELRKRLPNGRVESAPGGLRNIVGTLPGRRPAILVAAHYDTKALPGFVGANDGAAGTAVVLELARILSRNRPSDPSEVRFVLFDGEEAPRPYPAGRFYLFGLRGSKAFARAHAHELRAMILLDFVGNRRLVLPRELGSNPALWARLRAIAGRTGAAGAFPPRETAQIYDDHTPFTHEGVPAVDLIDFSYACFHKRCDNLAQISARSLARAGAPVAELVRELEGER